MLTKRKQQIHNLLGLGYSNAEIARSLSITETTVRVHLSAMFKQLGVNSRLKAALMCAQMDNESINLRLAANMAFYLLEATNDRLAQTTN
jgi:DNA-binding NarL/FixJ family response regulator